jgi:hypothetical protein
MTAFKLRVPLLNGFNFPKLHPIRFDPSQRLACGGSSEDNDRLPFGAGLKESAEAKETLS